MPVQETWQINGNGPVYVFVTVSGDWYTDPVDGDWFDPTSIRQVRLVAPAGYTGTARVLIEGEPLFTYPIVGPTDETKNIPGPQRKRLLRAELWVT